MIREAISGLGQRGFLVASPGRGHFLRLFTRKDVDDVFSFRICVETFAIRLPRGPDAVAEAARAEIGTISLQSVYDALVLLVAEGLVRRIQPAGSPARFEGRIGDNHHHLVCRVCGRVVDVDCATGSAPCLTASNDMGYEIEEAEVATGDDRRQKWQAVFAKIDELVLEVDARFDVA